MPKQTNQRHIVLDDYTFAISMVASGACFIKMLHKAKQQVDAMLSYYSKVYVVAVTVHPNQYTDTNERISKLMRIFRKSIANKASPFRFVRYGHAWFREAPNGDRAKHHYHLVLMLDGHKIRNPKRLLQDVLIPIGQKLGLSFYISNDDQAYMLTRKDRVKYDSCLYQLSYFSKVSGKGCRAPSSNDYSTSRLMLNIEQEWPGFRNESHIEEQIDL